MLCVVVLEVEDGDFSDLKGSALDVHSSVIVESTLKRLCQLGRMRSRVRFRRICIQLVAGFLLFRRCKSSSCISIPNVR